MNSFWIKRGASTILLMATAVGALSCSSDGARNLHLVDAPKVSADSEAERLRKLQLVTVIDNSVAPPQVTEIDASDLDVAAMHGCHTITGADGCASLVNVGQWELCLAKTLIAAASPQATVMRIGNYSVGPQTSETNAAIAAQASIRSRLALDEVTTAVAGFAGDPNAGICDTTDDLNGSYKSRPLPVVASTLMMEALQTYKEANAIAVNETESSSDAQLGSTSSANLAVARAVAGSALSRSAAAHLLVIGDAGLKGSTADAFCSAGDLSPEGQAALSVFRESALSPAAVLDSAHVTTLQLVDDLGSAVAGGSVAQRLAELYQYPALAAGQGVESYSGLSLAAFDQARSFMQQEIKAFARSITAVLPAKKLPDGQLTTYLRFAGTAAPPTPMPAAYYGAVARYYTGSDLYIFPPAPDSIYGAPGTYDSVVDWAMTHAGMLVKAAASLPSASRSQALAPAALMLASGERQGRVIVKPRVGSPIVDMVLEGYTAADGIRVALGEDQLRCAVTGSIEGMACPGSIGFPAITPATPSDASFQNAVGVGGSNGLWMAAGNVYILRPRIAGADAAPGRYEALLGFYFNPARQIKRYFPIIPSLEKRLAELLEPNKNNCSHPKVSCAGVDFDERLPLEDELASTTDGIESSWKHYLDLAKDAATQADLLGNDYVNAGVQQTENGLADQLRQEQQMQRADDEIKSLQSICGTAIDPRKLLALLAPSNAPGNVVCTSSSSWSTSTCTTTKTTDGTCTTTADCGRGYQCFANMCVVSLEKLAAANASDPDLRRIADCVSDSGLTDISLGDKPVCTWHTPGNSNVVCAGALPGECPQIAFKAVPLADGTYSNPCTTLGGKFVPPTGNQTPAQVASYSQPLGYFSTVNLKSGTVGECDAFRKLRKDPTRWPELSHQFTGTNTFHPVNVSRVFSKLSYEFRYGGFGAITFNNVPIYQTGSAFTGPANGWPCALNAQAIANCSDQTGMFCQATNCGNETARAATNYQMLRAVIASGLIGNSIFLSKDTTGSDIGKDNPLWKENTNKFHGCPFSGDGYSGKSDATNELNFWRNSWPIHSSDGDGFTITFALGSDSGQNSEGADVSWRRADGSPVYDLGIGIDCKPVAVKLTSSNVLDHQIFDGLSEYNPSGAGWVKAILSGNRTPPVSFGYALFQPFGKDAPLKNFDAEPVPFQHRIGAEDFLNALELACEQEKPLTEVSLAEPPAVKTVDDLQLVAKYIDLLAQDIRNQAGSRVFFNVPNVAVQSLEHASSTGSYPQFSGTLGAQLALLSGGLVRLKTTIPLLSNAVAQFGQAFQTLHDLLQKAAVKKKIDALQLLSTISQQIANCGSTLGAGSLFSAASEFECANSIAQIAIATQISKLNGQDVDLDADLAKVNFQAAFNSAATNMQSLGLAFQQESDDVDSALAQIEGLRDQAKLSLSRSLYLASYEAQNVAAVDNVTGNLFDGKQLRYTHALKNAKLMAFLAKRGIEERLGVKLSSLTDNLPLVDAPHDWESTVCDMGGIDYNSLVNTAATGGSSSGMPSAAATNYASGFIGDYVTKLSNVVESYRLINGFHEGSDTAVISLRDDLMNVRANCDKPGPNKLYYSSDLSLSHPSTGWSQSGCQMEPDGDGGVMAQPNCVVVTGTQVAMTGSGLANQETASAQGFILSFGSGAQATATLSQTIPLDAGTYRYTWYHRTNAGQGTAPNGLSPGFVAGLVSAPAALSMVASGQDPGNFAGASGAWDRSYIVFRLSSAQNVTVGFKRPSAGATAISVGGPMLESLPGTATDDYALMPFVHTTGVLTRSVPECQDTDGSVFRATQWHRDCQLLCPDGYSGNCSQGSAQPYCYREASFNFSQRDLQAGKIANYSGFARGNFNYRIQSVGINFVGTGTRDCADSSSPSACSAAGYFPYSLEHVGPFYVRNYAGQDYQAHLFDGRIEHARGLASERYLTNPLSSTDESLINQYFRSEFEGRPLDGTFVLRIWEEPGVNFEALQDVQLVFKYGYWTHLN